MSKTIRASVCALALALTPSLLLAEPDRGGDPRHGRRDRSEARSAPERRGGHRDARGDECCEDDHRHHRHRRCGCVEVVIPGFYRTVVETVRTPGHYERVWVPSPRIRVGRHIEVGLDLGCYERVWVPGECRRVERKVWVPARTVIERHCSRHCG